MSFNVIIVGGGLAGLTSALHLSKHGLSVLLIEKNAYPKHKVCGEYISNEVLPYLKALDFDPFDFGAKKIDHFSLSTPKSKSVDAKLPLGGFEINPWHSTFKKPDEPTYMMLDLDPGEISFKEVVNTALVIKEICDELKIPCYCKTSGKSGLHVFIPLANKYDYDEVKMFAEIMASLVHHRLPDTTSMERTVSKRKDKIYLDFLQNRKGQTIAAPYCVRPRENATV